MSADRELLELAAKAAGLEVYNGRKDYLFVWRPKDGSELIEWNPLTDDGDEARLEAALSLDVIWIDDEVWVNRGSDGTCGKAMFADHNGDRQAARRYAGVRAAAEIAKATRGADPATGAASL